MTNSPLFSITIYNPENGRSTDYDLAYLRTEAKMAAKAAGGKVRDFHVRVVERQSIALIVNLTMPNGDRHFTNVAL